MLEALPALRALIAERPSNMPLAVLRSYGYPQAMCAWPPRRPMRPWPPSWTPRWRVIERGKLGVLQSRWLPRDGRQPARARARGRLGAARGLSGGRPALLDPPGRRQRRWHRHPHDEARGRGGGPQHRGLCADDAGRGPLRAARGSRRCDAGPDGHRGAARVHQLRGALPLAPAGHRQPSAVPDLGPGAVDRAARGRDQGLFRHPLPAGAVADAATRRVPRL